MKPTLLCVVVLSAFSIISSVFASESPACPLELVSLTPDQHQIIKNHALVRPIDITIGVGIDKELETVVGKEQRRIWHYDRETADELQFLTFLSQYAFLLRIPNDDLHSGGNISEIIVKSARFANGSECKDGKLVKNNSCTFPLPASVIFSELTDFLCMLDGDMSAAVRSKRESTLKAKIDLPASERHCDMAIQVLALLKTEHAPKVTAGIVGAGRRCPGIYRSAPLLNPEHWKDWPYPQCIEACTGVVQRNAMSAEFGGRYVVSYSKCIAHCMVSQKDGIIDEINSLSDSDRRNNYPPAHRKAESSKRHFDRIFGIDLSSAASKTLSGFAAQKIDLPMIDCNKESTKCFLLTKITPVKALNGVERIVAVLDSDRISKISFQLQNGKWPTGTTSLISALEPMLGKPNVSYVSSDTPAEHSFANGIGLPLVLVAKWYFKGATVLANIVDYSPAYGEGASAEVIYITDATVGAAR